MKSDIHNHEAMNHTNQMLKISTYLMESEYTKKFRPTSEMLENISGMIKPSICITGYEKVFITIKIEINCRARRFKHFLILLFLKEQKFLSNNR